jgi:hypothetical protein
LKTKGELGSFGNLALGSPAGYPAARRSTMCMPSPT